MATVGEALINVAAEGAGPAVSELEKVAGALGVLGTAAFAVTGAGLAALGASLTFAVNEAMDSETAITGLNTVLKSSGGAIGLTSQQLQDMASNLQSVSKFSDEAAVAAETMLLRFENIGQDVFPQALKASADLATSMGIDLTSAAMAVGRALDNPAEGIGRLNNQFKLFNKEQLAAIQKMAEMGDVAGAQAAILDALNQKVGGAAEAMGSTAAGQLEIFKNKISDIGEGLGAHLLPILGQLLELVGPPLLGALTQAAEMLGKVADQVSFFITRAEAGLDPLTNFKLALISMGFSQAAEDIGNFVTALGDKLAPAFANIGASLATIGTQLTAFWQAHGDQIMAAVGFAFNAIVGIISGALQLIAGIIAAVTAAMNGNWNTALAALRDGAMGALNSIAGIFGGTASSVLATWNNLWSQVGIIVNALGPFIVTSVSNVLNNALTAANDAIANVAAIGKSIIDGIAKGIMAGAGGLLEKLVGAVEAAIAAAWKAIQGHSPSEVFKDIGLSMMQGAQLGIINNTVLPVGAMRGAMGSVVAGAVGAPLTGGLGMPVSAGGGGAVAGGNSAVFYVTIQGVSNAREMFDEVEREARIRGYRFAGVG